MLLAISLIFSILALLNVDAHPETNIVDGIIKSGEDRFQNFSKINEDLNDAGRCSCENGGTCSADGTCICPPMTSGQSCNVVNCSLVNPGCEESGGICRYSITLNIPFCHCKSTCSFFNYKLKICEENCLVDSCKNGGVCLTTGPDSNYCICPPGTFGKKCEEADCSKVNPQCIESGGLCLYRVEDMRPFCKCPENKQLNMESGKCEEKCTTVGCRNGGQCNSDGQCNCLFGTYGIKCENVNCYAINPVCEQSGGKCVYRVEERRAVCDCSTNKIWNETLGLCEDPCAENPCQNSGSCFAVGYTFGCLCKDSFFGRKCENDMCSFYPCFNGGACQMERGQPRCWCKYPYSGKWCEKDNLDATTDGSTTTEFVTTQTPDGIIDVFNQRVPLLILLLFSGLFILLSFLGCCMCWSNLKLKQLMLKRHI